jgi:DNA-directed RNA polymerase II subunit RPB2
MQINKSDISPFTEKQLKESTDKLNSVHYNHNKNRQLVKHHIESFNDFITRKIPDIIKGFNPIEIYHQYLPALSEEQGIPMFKCYMDVEMHNLVISRPIINEKDGSTKAMTPMDARNRNLTYSGAMTIDINIRTRVFDEETKEYVHETKQMNNIPLGYLPIMVGSRYCILSTDSICKDECPFDLMGYFIVNGTEKVVIPQDRIAENKTCVFINNKDPSYSYIAEIRSVQENRFSVPKTTTLKHSSKPTQFGHHIKVNIHHIKYDVPLFVLFRAFGVESDKEIMNYILYDVDDPDNEDIAKELIGSIEEANTILYRRDALEYLVKYLNINGYPREYLGNMVKRKEILNNVLKHECLPHVGECLHKKALYLGYMVNKLIKCYIGKLQLEERDSYINKRIDNPGVLVANLMRQYLGKVIKEFKGAIQKDFRSNMNHNIKFQNIINRVNIPKLIKPTTITSGIKFSLATGNWGINKNNKTKQGVAQVLNRLTYNSTLSHMRRISTPIDKMAKLIAPRKLHATQFGIICPAETPEGEAVGLVKNLSFMCTITISSDSTHLREILLGMEGLIQFDGSNIDIFRNKTKIFMNGDLIGVHDQPPLLYQKLKLLKRKGVVNVYTGIAWNIMESEIYINTEGGRCVRPFYIVDDNKIRMTPQIMHGIMNGEISFEDLVTGNFLDVNVDLVDLVDNSVIEYLDVEEVNTSMLAMEYSDLSKGFKGAMYPIQYTHLEMDPALILGVMAACIPFPDHNQAPRNCYQSAMAKQAIGIYTSNYRKRFDTFGHVLNYGQKNLVSTKSSKSVNADDLPGGINAIVAIASYTGYNQEDSIIMNKSSVDRGMFQSTYYKSHKEQNIKNHSTGEEEYFCKPNPKTTIKMKPYNYDKLGSDGFVKENTYVQAGDVLIGKCMPQKEGDVILNKDVSVALKAKEEGFVDKNFYNERNFGNVNGDGSTFCKVRVRSDRIPMIGDKFSSKVGQKGTIGMLMNQHDMPFTRDGLTPDIILNPHAIPSRMTIGQLIECILGKLCTTVGTLEDGTPFDKVTVEDIAQKLEACGMQRHCDEVMYNSQTGEQIRTDIFIGPTYYQRLKHMTSDKVHSRANNGSVVSLTHQPSQGAPGGGLRIGEMEVECLWAYGNSSFLKEKFQDNADNYRIFVCQKCGMMANVNPDMSKYKCNQCKNNTHFSQIRVPYAFKLMIQEIETMSIGTRFIPSKR